jgi:uncharacterized protein (DUF488 family)
MEQSIIYTIGHSNHRLDHFLSLFREHAIDSVVDVRSIAASRYNPQFNKAPLSGFLRNNHIHYLHFAVEFGARHTEPELLDEDGKVNFEKVRSSFQFRKGMDRIRAGLGKGHRITLMCAEADPFDCHRFSMISIALSDAGIEVLHILKDGTIKTNRQLEKELLEKYDNTIVRSDMFRDISNDQHLKMAYRMRNKDIAYSPFSQDIQEPND